MQKIEAQFEIVTPMFIGGGDHQESPEIRPPSIKGALRFWWRALHWGDCLKESANTDAALQLLHKREAELFGAVFKEDDYGQGKVLLKVKNLPSKSVKSLNLSSGQQYLLGQGLYHFREGLLKPALLEKQLFTVILNINNKCDAQELIDTVKIFGLLGGLGSRARKGWGSIAIRSLHYTDKDKEIFEHEIPSNKNSYKETLKDLLVNLPEQMPPFTAFSKQTRIDLSVFSNTSANSLLTTVGNEQQMYRSYGRKLGSGHKVNNKDAEQNFKNDHDLVLDFSKNKSITEHPKRVVFGLPHNYFYSNGTKVDVIAVDTTIPDIPKNKKKRQHRRTSPLFIHIHKLEGEYIAVQSLMQADFLADKDKVQLEINNAPNKGSKGKKIEVSTHVDWGDITNYLDRFEQRDPIL